MSRDAMVRVLVVLGTRPEAIKLAPVILELGRRPGIELAVCSTGQHREMLDQVLELFAIEADFELDVMRPNQDLAGLTGRLLEGISGVLDRFRADVVLVQGDTTSCFAGSLAAFYREITVAHVEAGLRTRKRRSPFPEEVNRRFTGLLSDFHFAPTEIAARNLRDDQVPAGRIFVTGNTVIDALHHVADRQSDPAEDARLAAWAGRELGLDPDRRWILVTGHRRENLGAAMEDSFRGIRRVAESIPDVEVVYPVHLNPKVRKSAQGLLEGCDRVHLVEPVDYYQLVYLLRRVVLVITDSGGIQEEAPTFGKPVLVTRDTTERPEGVHAGVARLIGTDGAAIERAAVELLTDAAAYRAMAAATNPYGDGSAARQIADVLLREADRS
ncbi:MAG: UDP-N-acetylglucosamine 2-epimerase (non-hydrolyzing) [Myxococcota bacterium]